MRGRDIRSLLFAACIFVFACLLLSGSQRLIAFSEEEAIPAGARVQAFLCSAPSYEADSLKEGGVYRQRGETGQQEAVRFMCPVSAALAATQSDANGNVLTSGVSYLRAVYQAFALGDGFA